MKSGMGIYILKFLKGEDVYLTLHDFWDENRPLIEHCQQEPLWCASLHNSVSWSFDLKFTQHHVYFCWKIR
jgi:hypothetical protein